MAASGDVKFTNEIDAIYDALKNLEFNTPDASMFVDTVRKPRYAVRVETEHTLEDGNTIADETFYIFKSDDGRIKAVSEDRRPIAFIDTDAVIQFFNDYFDQAGIVTSATKTAKRPIKASEDSIEMYAVVDGHTIVGDLYDTYNEALSAAKQFVNNADGVVRVLALDCIVTDDDIYYGESVEDGRVLWSSDGTLEGDGFIYSSTATSRVAKRPIKAAAGSDPYRLIKEHKDAFIDGWASEYEGEPETSWDNIFNNVLEEFRTYCGDEASDFIIDEYNEGRYTEGDMMSAFEQFIMFLDIPTYDE